MGGRNLCVYAELKYSLSPIITKYSYLEDFTPLEASFFLLGKIPFFKGKLIEIERSCSPSVKRVEKGSGSDTVAPILLGHCSRLRRYAFPMLDYLVKKTSLWDKLFNPLALRKAKIVYNFGLSECNRDKLTKLFINGTFYFQIHCI